MINLIKTSSLLENEPKFRLKQIDKLIFQDLIDNWDQATTLPLSLRQKLNEQVSLLIIAETQKTADNKTIKALITLEDGLKIEAVLMKYPARNVSHSDAGGSDRNTVCVSSQVGCPLGCLFCATGAVGFKRNLTISEIVGQVIFFARFLKEENRKITNIVFMGMGEPFLNYDNVLESIKILNNPEKMGLGSRRFSISTCGISEGIEKLAKEPLEINLAISLHAPNDNLRSQLMPINQKYPLVSLLSAVNQYLAENKRKVMFEYVLLNGVNDNLKEAEELVKLMRHPLYHLNLIEYNETGRYQPSSPEKTKEFKNILDKAGISYTLRQSLGKEIKGACGQLAVKV